MPIHDWTRVSAGIFHHFHHSWIEEIMRALNAGLLPADYYALSEQSAGDIGPDVLTLKTMNPSNGPSLGPAAPVVETCTVAVAQAPPRVRFIERADMDFYTRKQNRITIRHVTGDNVVAVIEIVSPGNKGSQAHFRQFLEKATGILLAGYHLLVLDLFPPSSRGPEGIHGAIWQEITDKPYQASPEKPLTLAAYDCGPPVTAYVEPIAIGNELPDMPLFLHPGHYINVPLQTTYQKAFQAVPSRWKEVLESDK